jgi:hypothetical protein
MEEIFSGRSQEKQLAGLTGRECDRAARPMKQAFEAARRRERESLLSHPAPLQYFPALPVNAVSSFEGTLPA